MTTFSIFLALIVIVALLLIIIIMVQNPKGGGLSSSFGGGGTQQIGGVQKTTDFLDKSTWVLATVLVGLILFSSISLTTQGNNASTKLESEINGVPQTSNVDINSSGSQEAQNAVVPQTTDNNNKK